jgi:hypothetical protein
VMFERVIFDHVVFDRVAIGRAGGEWPLAHAIPLARTRSPKITLSRDCDVAIPA